MSELATGRVHANGIDFHYLEAGKGPLVLCLHGFPDHAPSFRHTLPALAAAGFRAVAPFMRGYAPTGIPAEPSYQSAVLGQDVVGLLEALSPSEPAFVFGHDWGAIAAYAGALIAPARFRKLATSAVPYGPQFMQGLVSSYDQLRRSFYIWFFQLPAYPEMAVAANDFAFLERIWGDWSPGWELPAADLCALKDTFAKAGVLDAALGYYRHTFNPAFQRPELSELQAKIFFDPIDVPTMIFYGANDGCIGRELLDGMEASFPRGLEKVVLEGAGHFSHLEKPAEVNAALVRFFRS